MNPDHAKPLESNVEAIAEKDLSPSPSSAAATPQLIQLTALKLSQAAQNAENYKQSVIDASHSLEQLLKVQKSEFDYSQFFNTADVLLKAGKSPRPGGDRRGRGAGSREQGERQASDSPATWFQAPRLSYGEEERFIDRGSAQINNTSDSQAPAFKYGVSPLPPAPCPLPLLDKHSRSSILQNGDLELVDTPNRQSSSSSELNQQLDSQSIAQVNELRPDLVQPLDNTEAPPAEQVQSDRNVVPQYIDNAKTDRRGRGALSREQGERQASDSPATRFQAPRLSYGEEERFIDRGSAQINNTSDSQARTVGYGVSPLPPAPCPLPPASS